VRACLSWPEGRGRIHKLRGSAFFGAATGTIDRQFSTGYPPHLPAILILSSVLHYDVQFASTKILIENQGVAMM
jgi:hypothetical protein